MSHSNLRVAAGVGVVSAFLLVGVPGAAVAVADSGGHGGHSNGGGHSNDGKVSNSPKPAAESPSSKIGSSPAVRPGSDYSPAPSATFEPPKVTFGDGRTPGVQAPASEPRWWGSASEPAPPPPPPPPPPAPVIAPPKPTPPRVHAPVAEQLVVAPTSTVHDPLFGLAGLLLIPAAGAVLGYRQARAAQGAEKLRGS